MIPIRSILFPTDFSAQAALAFPLACALARDYGAHLVLLHVKPFPPAIADLNTLGPDFLVDNEFLQEQLSQLRPQDSSVEVAYDLREGEPADQILAVAHDIKCDLIVMGTHGRTGVSRLLMGSVAEQVVRKAPCPVLTVRVPITVPSVSPAVPEMAHV